jgi:hypothetical protein
MSLLASLDIPESMVLDPRFYVHLETHVEYFKNKTTTDVVSITGLDAEKYKGDLYGLLLFLGIERKYHFLVMRMNDMVSSSDYDGLRDSLRIPNISEASAIIQLYDSLED